MADTEGISLQADFTEKLAETRDDASAFSELVFGTPLHAGQRRYHDNAKANVNFLLPGNSWGKTEYILRAATKNAWFKEGDYQERDDFEAWLRQQWKGLIGSYAYPIAKESFDRFEMYHRNRPELQALVSSVTRTDPPRVTFVNGAVLDWGSLDGQGKLVEAARRQVIYVDEAGHIPDISATFDNILFPRTMGVGGRIHLLGTPKPHSDPYLLEVFEKGRSGEDPFYYAQPGSVLENEFWPPEERERLLSNPRYVKGYGDHPACEGEGCDDILCVDGQYPRLSPVGKQVILGEFVLEGGFFFNRWHVQRMFRTDDVSTPFNETWFGEDHFAAPPVPGHLHVAAFDLGGNRPRKKGKVGSDATCGFVADYTEKPWRIVRYDYLEGGQADWQQKYDLMAEVFHTYPMAYLLIDATGQIDSVQEALTDRGVAVEGVHFGGTSGRKFNMLRSVQLALELEWDGKVGALRSPLIPGLKHELDHYVLPDDHIKQDRVMALAMLVNEIMQWELPPASAGEMF